MRTSLTALALAGALSAEAVASPFDYSYFGLAPSVPPTSKSAMGIIG